MSAKTTWTGMIQRCTNSNYRDYHNYGGRGIKVCPRWRIFKYFLADMGEPPLGDYSIERKNNDEDYTPENCCWANRFTQNQNQRIRKDNTSGICGVSFIRGKWHVAINRKGKHYHLGVHLSIFEAACVRKSAENKLST